MTATTTRPVAPARLTGPSLLRLLLLASIWGCSFLFIKVAVEDDALSPMQVVLSRVVLGAVAVGVIVVGRHGRLPRDVTTWLHLAVVGVFANIAPFFLFAWGEQHVDSGLAGIYNAATPLFTLLVAMAALPEERPSHARLTGLVVGFLGVVVVLAPWRGVGGSTMTGQLACLVAAACYGVAIVYTRRFLSNRGCSSLVLAGGQLICSSVLMLLAVPLWATGRPQLTAEITLSLLALGALGTGVAYLIFYRLIGEVGATTASTVTYVVPVVAVALGVIALGERIGWNDFAGAAVVVLGIALAEGRLRLLLPSRRAGVVSEP